MIRTFVAAACLLAPSWLLAEPVAKPAQSPSIDRLFYIPTHDEPATPKSWGYGYDDLFLPSGDDRKLHAWLLHQKGPLKGLVVFSHGNAGSMGHHLGFVTWFAKAGYKVLMYDYRGFGKSDGEVSRQGMIDDARTVFHYVRDHQELSKLPVISYGHSMGGAKSIAALAEHPLPSLKAIIVDSTFASYRDMALHVGGQVSASLTSDQSSPISLIPKLSPQPLLVIHGRKDP